MLNISFTLEFSVYCSQQKIQFPHLKYTHTHTYGSLDYWERCSLHHPPEWRGWNRSCKHVPHWNKQGGTEQTPVIKILTPGIICCSYSCVFILYMYRYPPIFRAQSKGMFSSEPRFSIIHSIYAKPGPGLTFWIYDHPLLEWSRYSQRPTRQIWGLGPRIMQVQHSNHFYIHLDRLF